MMFNSILKTVGGYGRYQVRVYSLVVVLMFCMSWEGMVHVFLAASVDHWCPLRLEKDYNCSAYGLTPQECHIARMNASIPSNTSDDHQHYAQCEKYNTTGAEFQPGPHPPNHTTKTPEMIPCDGGWEYDNSQYKSSIVIDFDLVCGKEILLEVSQTVFYGGYLAGAVIFGFLSDVIGRWRTILICTILRVVSGFLLAFSPYWWVFTLLRFFQGMGKIASYGILYILGTEYIGRKKRRIAGILFCIPYSLGYIFLALLAYCLPYWRTLQFAVTGPLVLFFFLAMLLPESTRWLVSVGKYDKAEKIIHKIADVNKRKAPDPVFTEEFKKEQEMIREEVKPTILDLFRMQSVRLRTLILIFNWMVHAMVYTGLSLNSSNLGINDYVAFVISGAVEIPAYILTIFTVKKFGRKPSLIALVELGGIACLCTAATPSGVWLTTVEMIGKFGITGSFAVLTLYTAELYPANIRPVAVGICAMSSRVANMLAPLTLALDKDWKPMPLVIYGLVAVLAGFFSFFLPETKGQKLREAREDAENFGTKLENCANDPEKNGFDLEKTGNDPEKNGNDPEKNGNDPDKAGNIANNDTDQGYQIEGEMDSSDDDDDDDDNSYVNPAFDIKA